MRRFWNKHKRIILIVLAVLLFIGYNRYTAYTTEPPPQPTLNQLEDIVGTGDVNKAEVNVGASRSGEIKLTMKDGKETTFAIPVDRSEQYINALIKKGVTVTMKTSSFKFTDIFGLIIPILFIASMMFTNYKMGFFSKILNPYKPQKSDVKFSDVAGINEIRDQLQQMVEAMVNPKSLQALGGRAPRGTLLVGPSGTGKTLLARAVAGEAKVPFFAVSGSEFDEMFVGVGASRIRDIFKAAQKSAPSIIFIDEIDAIGKKRTEADSKHSNQSINQLLTNMDGFKGETGVLILGATNRVEDLDPALRRPGRFDREIQVPLPDLIGREDILKVTVRNCKVPLAPDVNLAVIARATPGFSGAALANLVNEAALYANTSKGKFVTMDDFEHAREKITLGVPRSRIISENERRIVAHHEAGHVLMALKHHDKLDPIYKATIQPRGGALGMVVTLPESDSMMISLKKIKAIMAMTAGGRAAEKTILDADDITTGAANDMQQITHLANRMVTEWGLGKSGYQAYRNPADAVNGTLGRMMEISPHIQAQIDAEIAEIVRDVTQEAEEFVKGNKQLLEDIATLLLQKETVDGEELRKTFLPQISAETSSRPSKSSADNFKLHSATSLPAAE